MKVKLFLVTIFCFEVFTVKCQIDTAYMLAMSEQIFPATRDSNGYFINKELRQKEKELVQFLNNFEILINDKKIKTSDFETYLKNNFRKKINEIIKSEVEVRLKKEALIAVKKGRTLVDSFFINNWNLQRLNLEINNGTKLNEIMPMIIEIIEYKLYYYKECNRNKIAELEIFLAQTLENIYENYPSLFDEKTEERLSEAALNYSKQTKIADLINDKKYLKESKNDLAKNTLKLYYKILLSYLEKKDYENAAEIERKIGFLNFKSLNIAAKLNSKNHYLKSKKYHIKSGNYNRGYYLGYLGYVNALTRNQILDFFFDGAGYEEVINELLVGKERVESLRQQNNELENENDYLGYFYLLGKYFNSTNVKQYQILAKFCYEIELINLLNNKKANTTDLGYVLLFLNYQNALLKKYIQTEENLQIQFEMAENIMKFNDKILYASVFTEKASILNELGKYDLALKQLETAKSVYEKLEIPVDEMRIYEIKKSIFYNLANYEKNNKYKDSLKLYTTKLDQLQNEEIARTNELLIIDADENEKMQSRLFEIREQELNYRIAELQYNIDSLEKVRVELSLEYNKLVKDFIYKAHQMEILASAFDHEIDKNKKLKKANKNLLEKIKELDKEIAEKKESLEKSKKELTQIQIEKNKLKDELKNKQTELVKIKDDKALAEKGRDWAIGLIGLATLALIILLVLGKRIKNKNSILKKENNSLTINLNEKQEQYLNEKIRSANFAINPHFLCNLLGVDYLNLEIFENNPKDLIELYVEISQMVEQFFINCKKGKCSVKEELELITKFGEIKEKIFTDNLGEKIVNFNVNCNVDNEKLTSIIVPSNMIFQCVENAYKHGFEKSKNINNEINIEVIVIDNKLEIIVSNNGKKVEENYKENIGHKSIETLIEGFKRFDNGIIKWTKPFNDETNKIVKTKFEILC